MQKQPVYRNAALLAYAKHSPCQNPLCQRDDGTVVAAHYSGPNSYALGKGKGIKPSDMAIAYLCASCHAAVDTGISHEGMRYDCEDQLLLWAVAHVKTMEWLISEGMLHVGKFNK